MCFLTSCEAIFGSKHDKTAEEIFEQGKIDPNLIPNAVGYVPVLPVWNFFTNPVDVYVGYDELVYVIDDNGLNILDQKGQRHNIIAIPGAKEVVQDRRLHTYVSGKVPVQIGGNTYQLAAVYHFINTASGNPVIIDTIIHPFSDVSRRSIPFRTEDVQVEFTGLATRADNVLYVGRRGPVNSSASAARPDNTVLFFDLAGTNIGYANGLNPSSPSLKSALGIEGLASFATPPQRLSGVSNSHDFLLTQTDPRQMEFRVLWIREQFDPDAGTTYAENTALLDMDTSKASGFLYESNKFTFPADVWVATDAAGYIFVVDAAKDLLYQFTSRGWEGVLPPPSSGINKYIKVSFGGKGNGPFQFNYPSGVCYFDRIVYVADKGNDRIMRYTLNTDIE